MSWAICSLGWGVSLDSLLFFLPLYPELLLLLFLLAHQTAVLGENLGRLGGRVGAWGAF